MLLIVILSPLVCFSHRTMVSFHCHRCWLLFSVFFGFLISHECDHSLGSLLTPKLLCWAIILSPYISPQKHASRIVLCSGNVAVDCDWCCSDITPISSLLAAGDPPVKNCPGLIIRRRRADSATRWEQPQDLTSTSLGPSAVTCCPCRNGLETEAYPWSILTDGWKYREWKEIPKVQLSSRGDSGLPPG